MRHRTLAQDKASFKRHTRPLAEIVPRTADIGEVCGFRKSPDRISGNLRTLAQRKTLTLNRLPFTYYKATLVFRQWTRRTC